MLKRTGLCWIIFLLWGISCLAAAALTGSAAGSAAAGAQALLMMALVAVHGSTAIGWGGMAKFVGIVALVTFALEACSIATGFPFGFYVHHMPGPRLLGVPAFVVIAYVLLSWFAWNIACVLIGEDGGGMSRGRWTTPIVAAFVLAGYDFVVDPINATVQHLYSYRFPGGTLGVPLTNFLGWLFTGWVAFQLFALAGSSRLALSGREPAQALLPCFVWLVLAAQYPLLLAHAPEGMSAVGNRRFVTADVYAFAASASLFAIILPAVTAIARLIHRTNASDIDR